MADVPNEVARADALSNTSAPVGDESTETARPVAVETSLSSSKDSLAVTNANEQDHSLEVRADGLATPQKAQDGIPPGTGGLHQTMHQMNQGINEIAACKRHLFLLSADQPFELSEVS